MKSNDWFSDLTVCWIACWRNDARWSAEKSTLFSMRTARAKSNSFNRTSLRRRWRASADSSGPVSCIKIIDAKISFRRIWFFWSRLKRRLFSFKKLWVTAFVSFGATITTRDRTLLRSVEAVPILIQATRCWATPFRSSKSSAKMQITSLNRKIRRA